MVLEKNLLRKVDEIYKDISTHPEYSQKLNEKLQKNLFFEANYQSFIMDSPETTHDKRISIPDYSGFVKSEVEKISKWAIENCHNEINENYIMEIARMYDSNNICYRNVKARLKNTNIVVPGPHKIQDEMDKIIFELNYSTNHPLEKAILAHLHLIRVQPFSDGNKRTARMVQNAILKCNGMPPIRIGRAEGSFYKNLLLEAIKGHDCRVSTTPYFNGLRYGLSIEEKNFYDYLASKELDSLGKIQHDLALSRKYKINFNTNEIDLLFRAKKNLQNNIITHRKDAKVRFDKKKKEITVTGDIDKKTVQIALKSIKSLNKNDYKIEIMI